MDDLRIGVIGGGGRGGLASHAHRPGDGSRVMACCDVEPSVLTHCRERYGDEVFVTQDYRQLLEQELDAVFVCTPDFLHEEQAVAALQAGAAVYLEKPMAITVEGCDRVLEAGRASGAPLYLGHNMRHMPVVLRMKELLDDGAIGEVKTTWCRHFIGHGGDFYFKDWHADRRFTTGLLLQKAAHDIDVMHWLAGGYGRRVHAMGTLAVYGDITDRHGEEEKGNPSVNLEHWPPAAQKKLNPLVDVEDVSMLNMELTNGVLASYQQCHFTPDYWRNYTIIGTEGRLENFGDTDEGAVIKLWNRRSHGYHGEADHVFPVNTETGGHGGADERIVREFVAYVKGERVATTSPVAARYSVAVGCAATESLRNGGIPVDVPPLEADLAAYFDGS